MSDKKDFWELMRAKTQKEIAEHLALKDGSQGSVSRFKSGERGFSPEISRKIAFKTGENAPTLYLTSQLASMEQKAATKSISEAGWFGSAQTVMRNITQKFRPDELRAAKKDPEFTEAATRLRELLLRALDLIAEPQQFGPVAGSGNSQGPTYTGGDSVEAALKSRDAHGKAMNNDTNLKIERDGFGRRIGR
jgi:hypothetical protein